MRTVVSEQLVVVFVTPYGTSIRDLNISMNGVMMCKEFGISHVHQLILFLTEWEQTKIVFPAGKAICLLTKSDLAERSPGSGDVLHNVLQLLMRDAQTLQRCLPSSPVTPTSRHHYPLSPHHITGTSHPSTPTWNNLLTSTAVTASDFQTPTLAHLVHQGNSVTLSPAPSVDSQSGMQTIQKTKLRLAIFCSRQNWYQVWVGLPESYLCFGLHFSLDPCQKQIPVKLWFNDACKSISGWVISEL